MKLVSKVICASMMLAGSVQIAVASDTTWDFSTSTNNTMTTSNVYYNSSTSSWDIAYGNTVSVKSGDDVVKITAWSDTDEQSGDDKIQSARAYANSHGLLNYNRDGNWNEDHLIDNGPDDTDMMLFEFTDAVSLSSLQLGYIAQNGDSDLSIAAFSSLPTLAGNTWAQVASSAVFTTSFADVGYGVLNLSSVVTEAKYWLIGAYHRAFGGNNWSNTNDGFKILALTTHSQETPPSEVSAPATGGLMALLIGMMVYRRRLK